MKSYREPIQVDGSPMNLYVSQPDGSGPFPAVMLIQHQNGVDKFLAAMTERVAAAGYFGVTPDLYHRDDPDCKDDGPTRRGRLRDRGGSIFRSRGDGPSPFDRTAEIHCPIQGHFGKEDKNRSLEDIRKLDLELARLGKTHEFYSYPEANHGLMDPHHGSRYHGQADHLSWPRTPDFFRKHLTDAAGEGAIAS